MGKRRGIKVLTTAMTMEEADGNNLVAMQDLQVLRGQEVAEGSKLTGSKLTQTSRYPRGSTLRYSFETSNERGKA